jgi:hypothetical protein
MSMWMRTCLARGFAYLQLRSQGDGDGARLAQDNLPYTTHAHAHTHILNN